MLGVEFFGNVDLASVSIWMFWVFFACLIYYIQRENMREGYPLENEGDGRETTQSPYSLPNPKTFHLPHGRGEVTVPSKENEDAHRRTDLALAPSSPSDGTPYIPTGDAMDDGVGPASWVSRKDLPELDGKGYPKIVPMSHVENFSVSAGRDPRGMRVGGRDNKSAGIISDMWVDEPEQLVRYLEVELEESLGGGKRLIPMTLCRITRDYVMVRNLKRERFAGIPQHKSAKQVTLLEEDKISGYVAGGQLYA